MDLLNGKKHSAAPLFADIPDYDILAPVRVATDEEISGGLAVPVSVSLRGVIKNLIPANFTPMDSEAALSLDKKDIENLNAHTDEFIKTAIDEDLDVVTRGVLVSSDGMTELRYCEDIYSDGIPESKSLTVVGFDRKSPETAFLVHSLTSDWREFIRKMADIKADEMLKRLLRVIFSADETPDIEPEDRDVTGGGQTPEEEADDGQTPSDFDTVLIFSRKYVKNRIYFGNSDPPPVRIIPGGGPSCFILTTEIFENDILFPSGGTIRLRYSIDSNAMTQQRADLTITVKPIEAKREK